MTVIVLNSDSDTVVLAADQQWTDDTDLVFYRSKIQKIKDMHNNVIGAIGTAGDGKKGLQFESAVLTSFSESSNADPYELLQEICAIASIEDTAIADALVVVNGRGFHIDEEGLVLEQSRWAIGSGALVAMGIMWDRKGSAERLARKGCLGAIALMGGCGGSVDVFSMPIVP